MMKEKNAAMYIRMGNYEQLDNPIEHIIERAKQGEIKTLLVSNLERLCEDPKRRETVINELTSYGVEIITAYGEEKKSRRCAIYNRYSVDDPERLAEVRGRLLTYCTDTLGIEDYVLFEEIGSVLEKREVFDDMMNSIENGEFTDLLVNHIDRIFKPAYDPEKLARIVGDIGSKINIHTVNR